MLHSCFFFFFNILFIYSGEGRGQRHRQREKQAPRREPNVGLDPGSPGSHPRLQAALNRCTTGAAQHFSFTKRDIITHQQLMGGYVTKQAVLITAV